MMADTEHPNKLRISLEQLEESSQTGWNSFSRFITVTTICVVVTVLLIAAFTVWS
ncbi:unnamed protein product [Acidocella sp. C78]|nr:unnamed protein product [Acidocella sp. C78]